MNTTRRTGVAGPLFVIVGGIVGVIVLVCAFGYLLAFHSVSPSDICVVQRGGPFDGRTIKDVRQPASGVSNIGIWNKQRCFPATERNFIISAKANESDSKTVDFVEVPTSDAVNVRVEGQFLFRLNTDPGQIKDFYKKFGVRTYDGKHPYDGNSGWENFLAVQIRPILDNALREEIGHFECQQLNNTCQYVQNPDKAVKGEVTKVDTAQNITQAQDQIAKTLQADLDSTLGGHFFEGIQFRFRGVTFDPKVQDQITAAQAKRTEVSTAQLDAQKRVAQAEGDRLVAEKTAQAIAATESAYKNNPQQADIDKIKALCGIGGCQGLTAIGGNLSTIVGGK